jgi:hypothetical protein
MKTKDLTDKQIQEQINALEEENANTQRLSMGRGHGWGDDAMERRRDKINRLESIQLMRRLDKRKATPKKEGLSRTWDSKAKRWVYHYTKRTKKAKKQPDTKLSQRDKWLLAGEYKVRGKPKDVRGLGKAVTSGLNIPEIPTGMTLQKSLSKTGGQMHFKNGGGKKKPKTLTAKKTKKRAKRIKKGSDNLMTFGIKMPDVRTLEDMMR